MDALNGAPQLFSGTPITVLLPHLWCWPHAFLATVPTLIAYFLATTSLLSSLLDIQYQLILVRQYLPYFWALMAQPPAPHVPLHEPVQELAKSKAKFRKTLGLTSQFT